MNKNFILFNLGEAQEEIERIISDLKSGSDYDYGEYVVAMTHLYHHINTAWNARNAPKKRVEKCSEKDFKNWRQFPREGELFLEC